MQSSITDAPAMAFEGSVPYAPDRQVSAVASEMIYFGKAVSMSKTADLSLLPPTVRLMRAADLFYGVAPADVMVERLASPETGIENQAGYGAYVAKSMPRVIRKGCVWVKTADEVDDLSKSVFVRTSVTAGTAATVTDTTTYTVADQDTKSFTITLSGTGVPLVYRDLVQTVLFDAATTTALLVAAKANDELKGVTVGVAGGQVVFTTDYLGSDVTIAAGVGDSALTFDTPVAGTGDTSIAPANALGSFRATTTTGYTDLGAIAAIKWLRSATIGGEYYGLLELNLP